MRNIPAVNFRIIYQKLRSTAWMSLSQFLFAAFSTQLQWLTFRPKTTDASNMVSSILLIQTVVSSQESFIGRANIATSVITITYGITGKLRILSMLGSLTPLASLSLACFHIRVARIYGLLCI